jgi:RNA polymerase sigma-70 factor (ECF subfamily)
MQLLIERVKKHERKAQEILYKKYAEPFFVVSLRYLADESDAAEVINNTFLKISENIHSFHFINNKAFEGWMFKILVNEALMYLRNRGGVQFVEMENAAQFVTNADNSKMEHEDYLVMIQKLPAGYRTVFNLYAIEGYSHQEISEMLSITESASRSQLCRAREMLKNFIKKEWL